MGALLAAELRRVVTRRLVRALALLAVAGILIASTIVFFKTSKDVPDLAAQREAAILRCIETGQFPPEVVERFCREQAGNFGPQDKRFHLSELKGILGGTTVPLVIGAWLIGASLVGAEWRAGTIATLLTWEPRRARVMLAKAAAAVITGVVLMITFQALLGLALLPSALFHGTTAGFDLGEIVAFVSRACVLAAVGAGIGFSLGSLGRNTTAAMALGFIYLAVLEGGLLGNLFPGIRQWLIVGNSIVFMTGESFDIAGRSQAGAAVLLIAYGAGALALATAAFRARDVTA